MLSLSQWRRLPHPDKKQLRSIVLGKTKRQDPPTAYRLTHRTIRAQNATNDANQTLATLLNTYIIEKVRNL